MSSKRIPFSTTRAPQPVLMSDIGIPSSSWAYRPYFENDVASTEMRIDGSVTPQTFSIKPLPSTDSIIDYMVLRLEANSISPTAPNQANRFTATYPSPGLPVGIEVEYYRGNEDDTQTLKVQFPITTTRRLRTIADLVGTSIHGGSVYVARQGEADVLEIRLASLDAIMRYDFLDELRITINDNLAVADIISFQAIGVGREGRR